jgi:hypothetical protein
MLRRTFLFAALAACVASGGVAKPYTHTGGDYYTNSSAHRVHRPMQSIRAPSGATAHCRDGSWSFSEHHRGTCSHHGGVGSWN